MKEPLLAMRGITKRFPGVVANDAVDLTVYPGEIHALLGENGAGKSTLMNILSGIYYPSEGTITYKGREIKLRSPRHAVRMGIGMVHQHYRLVDTLSVANNLYLYADACPFFLHPKKMEEDVRTFSEKYELPVDPAAKIQDLSVGEQQRVEILKLLYRGAELLILDEPTAVLTPKESESLFAALKKMTGEGKTVLFISHKLDEIMNFADRITVLRDGKTVGTMRIADSTPDAITKLMIGRELHAKPQTDRAKPEETAVPVLHTEGLCVKNNRGLLAVRNVDLSLFGGQILGIAGISGNGQIELAEALAGIRAPSGGKIFHRGEQLRKYTARSAIERGIAYIPDDRMGTGLVGALGIPQNLLLKNFRDRRFSRLGVLRRGAARAYSKEMVDAYDVRQAGMTKPVSLMSGGNMQKLLLAREISGNPALIIASCPTRGLDVGATESIHELLRAERDRGAAILLISEDLDELFRLSDQIAVICGGEITPPLPVAKATVEEIGRRMTGAGKEMPS